MAGGYGLGATTASVQATGNNPTAGDLDQTYTFSVPQKKVVVWNHPDSGIDMKVIWNGTTAAAGVWDAILEPGDAVYSPSGLHIANLSVHFSGAGTLGTDFAIRGWD